MSKIEEFAAIIPMGEALEIVKQARSEGPTVLYIDTHFGTHELDYEIDDVAEALSRAPGKLIEIDISRRTTSTVIITFTERPE